MSTQTQTPDLMSRIQAVAATTSPTAAPSGDLASRIQAVASGKVGTAVSSEPIGPWAKLGAGLSAAGELNGPILPPGAGQIVAGVAKGAAETVHGIGKFLGMTGEEPEELKPQGGLEHIGSAMETVGEFMAGDEALKALSIADKLKMVSGIADVMQKYPVLARIIGTGARTGAVAGVQQTGKTGSAEEGLKAAGEGAVLGGTLEGISGPLQAPIKSMETSAQAESRVASQADSVLQKYARKLGATAPPATSFGDAADKIRGVAQQKVFKVLDEVSDGEFSTLQNTIQKAKAVTKRASAYGDLLDAESTIKNADDRIMKLIDMNKDKLSPESYQTARAAWKDASVLDRVDFAVDGAFNVPEEAAKLTGDARVMKATIGKRLNALIQRIPVADLDRTLGPNGAKNLYAVARENSSPIIDALADSPIGKMGKTAQDARRLAVKYLISNPRAGRMFSDAVRIGASPKVVVPAIIGSVRSESNETQ
jgi:hypothetical protein